MNDREDELPLYCEYVAPGIIDERRYSPKARYRVDNRVPVRAPVLAKERRIQDNAAAVVLITRADRLERDGDGWRFVDLGVYGTEVVEDLNEGWPCQTAPGNRLCKDEAYLESPFVRWGGENPLRGTGVIVAPGVVLTAYHCVEHQGTRSQLRFVRDARELHDSFAPSDVGEIVEILYPEKGKGKGKGKGKDKGKGGGNDLALVRVRPVIGKDVFGGALSVLPSPIYEPHRRPVYTIGHPFGLPTMFAGCALAFWSRSIGQVGTSLDCHPGSSGSPVFDAKSHGLVGIVTEVSSPFKNGDEGRCRRIDKSGVDSSTYIERIEPIKELLENHRRIEETMSWTVECYNGSEKVHEIVMQHPDERVTLRFAMGDLWVRKDENSQARVDLLRSEISKDESAFEKLMIEVVQGDTMPEVDIAEVDVTKASKARITMHSLVDTLGKTTLKLDVDFPGAPDCEHKWDFRPADGPPIPLKVQVKRKNL